MWQVLLTLNIQVERWTPIVAAVIFAHGFAGVRIPNLGRCIRTQEFRVSLTNINM